MHPKIKHMVKRMQEKEEASAGKKKARRRALIKSGGEWLLYILRCNDGSFYTGVTKDLEHRLKVHNAGKASRYTRTHLPVELVYQEKCGTRTQALVREAKVKSFPRTTKEALVKGSCD